MLTLIKTRKLGLEVFELYHNNTLVGSFLSEQLAMTKYSQLERKLKQS